MTTKPALVPRLIESPEVIEARWKKKKARIEHLSTEIRRLRLNISSWLKSDDEKEFLTALVIAMMDKTFERIGNDSSAENGHYGVTGWKKNHVSISGNQITLKYTGKSGVEHEKVFSDEKLAKALKRAVKNSPSSYIFETSDGFRIKADRVNRILKNFGINCKDLRGYGANRITVEALNKIEPEETDKKRKKQLNKILKQTAEKVGHGRPTLRKHYLVPELWDEWVERGKIIDLKDMGYLEKGGEVSNDDIETKRIALNKAVDEAEVKLQEFIRPHKQASGLIPNEVKESKEYKEVKKKFDTSFNELREFNSKNKPKRSGYNIKKENGGEIDSDKIKGAIRDVYYSRSARLEPEFKDESYRFDRTSEPNSFKTTKTGGTMSGGRKWSANNIIAYDEDGKIVGVLSISETEPEGAFKITVREDARRKGWAKKLLDKAEESGFDMVSYMDVNNFTPSGRWAVIDWLSSKLSSKELKEAQKEFSWLKKESPSFESGGKMPTAKTISKDDKKYIDYLMEYVYYNNPIEEEDEMLPSDAPDWIIKGSYDFLKKKGVNKIYRGIGLGEREDDTAWSWTYDRKIAEHFTGGKGKILERPLPKNVISTEFVFDWANKNNYLPQPVTADFTDFIRDFTLGENEVIVIPDRLSNGGKVLEKKKSFLEFYAEDGYLIY